MKRTRIVWLGLVGLIACSEAKNGNDDQGVTPLPDLTGVPPGADLSAPSADLAGVDFSGSDLASSGNTCLSTPLLSSLGKTNILLGASMTAATAKLAPFDGRYMYLSGGVFDGATPCASCASSCTVDGTTCANSGPGCSWWGCWQWDQDPPGGYVRGFVDENQANTYESAAYPACP